MRHDYEHGLVSVVVPVYNREDVIAEALDSVRQQTYRPIELLVIDDGSTDGSLAVINQWRESLPSSDGLTVSVLSEEHAGAQAARNRGLLRAKGEYIHLFDSDDVMAEAKLEKQVKALRESNWAGFAACDCAIFKNDWWAAHPVQRLSEKQHTLEGHLGSTTVNNGVVLYKRDTIGRLGLFDEELEAWQDFDYTSRLFVMNIKGVWLPEVLTYVRAHQNTITARSIHQHHWSCYRCCVKLEDACRQRNLATREVLDAIGNRIVFYIAVHLARANRIRLALCYYARAFRLMNWRSRIRALAHVLAARCGYGR